MNKFIATKNQKIFYTSNEFGLKPIMSPIKKDEDFFKDADIEDTIIGKAAASLLVYAKVHSVYAHTLSVAGKKYLEKYEVSCTYDHLVQEIRNRDNTDMCPMEKAVMHLNDPKECKQALERTIEKMMTKNSE